MPKDCPTSPRVSHAFRRFLTSTPCHPAARPERIGRKAVDVGEFAVIPMAAASVAVGMAGTDRIVPPACRGRTGTCSIFPFRFARETIRAAMAGELRMFAADFCIQPGNVGVRVVPIEAGGGPAARLVIVRRPRKAVSRRMPLHLQNRIAGLGLVTGRAERSGILRSSHRTCCVQRRELQPGAAGPHSGTGPLPAHRFPSRNGRPGLRPLPDSPDIPEIRDLSVLLRAPARGPCQRTGMPKEQCWSCASVESRSLAGNLRFRLRHGNPERET